ncbi:MAG: sulfatase [Pirellulaceae bacterium]
MLTWSKTKRRRTTAALLLLAVAAVYHVSPAAGETALDAQPHRNVLLILADDLRPALGCYGHPIVKSPNIDRLAASGTIFTHAYCQLPSCCPSRTSLLTGLRPESTHVLSNGDAHFREHLPEVVTLPQRFKSQGAWCMELGKVFHRRDPRSWSEPKWIPEPPLAYPIYRTPPNIERQRQARVTPKPDDWWGYSKWIKADSWEAPDVADDALFDGLLAGKAVELLAQHKDERFFLAVGFFRPHLPFIAPKKYFDLYPQESITLPENDAPPKDAPTFAAHNSPESRSYDDIPRGGAIAKQKQRQLLRAYYASVSYVDAQIGRVLDALEDNGLAENTVVVLVSDHGYHFGEHGMWNKLTNFEEATRATLIVRAPGHKPGRSPRLVELVDLYPTLCALCDVPPSADLEGTSFAPLLDAPDRPWKTAAFSQANPRGVMGYSLRTERYRYVAWRKNGEVVAEELYDHRRDTGENVNLAESSEKQVVLEQLRGQLTAGWRADMQNTIE